MPSEKVLKQKQEAVEELVKKLRENPSGVLVNYEGITVEDDTKLRANLRKEGVHYKVIKNTLIEFAVKEIGLESLVDTLHGTTALAINTQSPTAAAKVLCEFASKNDKFTVKGGFIDGEALDENGVKALSKLPSKEVLVAMVLAGFNAPISGLVNVLNGNIRGLAVALDAIREKKAAEVA